MRGHIRAVAPTTPRPYDQERDQPRTGSLDELRALYIGSFAVCLLLAGISIGLAVAQWMAT